MKALSPRLTSVRSALPALGIALAGAALLLAGCLEPEKAVVLEDPPTDSVTFWPPHLRYARQGDTLFLDIHGLKRGRVCAEPVQIGWNFRRDSTGSETYTARARFVIPAGASCAADPAGLDTLFRVRFFTRVGNRLYLENTQGTATDSVLFIANDARDHVTVLTIAHAAGSGDSATAGRAVFYDSTAAHPRRTLHIRDLAACEVLQAAVYERRGDTTVVKARLIKGAPQPAATFPPCTGARADSLEAVFNRYNYLP